MARLGLIVEIIVALWFAALAVVVVARLFTGRIVSTGVLAMPNGPPVAASRLQLVLMTCAVAGGYALVALLGPRGGPLPDPPIEVVLALLGSHGVYLGNKASYFGGSGT